MALMARISHQPLMRLHVVLLLVFLLALLPRSAEAQPSNDDYLAVLPLESGTYTTLGATRQAGEPLHSGISGSGSVWFKAYGQYFAGGWTTVDVMSTAMTPTMAVYLRGMEGIIPQEGPYPLDQIVAITSNRGYRGNPNRAKITFYAPGSRWLTNTYSIAVDGAGSQQGQFTLAVRRSFYPEGAWKGPFTYAFTGLIGRPLSPSGGSNIWRNETDQPLTFDLVADQPWVQVPAQLTIPADSEAEMQFTLVNLPTIAGDYTATITASLAGQPTQQRGQHMITLRLESEIPQAQLYAAVLPIARSTSPGSIVNTFASGVNAGPEVARQCRLLGDSGVGNIYSYFETNPVTNAIIGNPNPVFDLGVGQSKSFVVQTHHPLAGQFSHAFAFDCLNTAPSPTVQGVSNFLVSVTLPAPPDIIVSTATTTGDSILSVPRGGAAAFAAASINIGAAAGAVTVDVSPTPPGQAQRPLPLSLTLCETEPSTGACLSPAAPAVTVASAVNQIRTFTIFAQSTGSVPFDPATNRLFLTFRKDGVLVGGSSVAVRSD